MLKKQGRSISNIVEEYLKTITSTSKNDVKELHPNVKKLWGSVKLDKANTDYDDILKDALIQKYVK